MASRTNLSSPSPAARRKARYGLGSAVNPNTVASGVRGRMAPIATIAYFEFSPIPKIRRMGRKPSREPPGADV
jgi:hypothetical protein